jgi:hypothetical protein
MHLEFALHVFDVLFNGVRGNAQALRHLCCAVEARQDMEKTISYPLQEQEQTTSETGF